MHRLPAFRRLVHVSFLSLGVVLGPTLGAQTAQDAGGELDAKAKKQVARLADLLASIKSRLASYVTPERIAALLRSRDSGHGIIKPVGGNKPAVAKPPVVPTKRRSRLLGDAEREGLPPGSAFVVNGNPVLKAEVDELATYFSSYAEGTRRDHEIRANEALIAIAALRAAFKDKLPALASRINEYHAQTTKENRDFGKLAREVSDGPSKAKDGDLGFFGRSSMVPTFAQRAFTLQPGQVSEPFLSPFGYHIIKVTGKQKGSTAAEDRVRASHILVMFTQDQAKIRELMGQAKSGACDVAVLDSSYREKLPEAYR